MRKLLLCLGILGLAPSATHAFATMPDNPIAFGNCTAKVKVDAARLRSGPSLESKVLGVRTQDEPLYVTKVFGKWVQVVMTDGDTAYIAAYLLSFPANEILEQWKRTTPAQSVGKKAKVKWAKVNFRKYPSAHSPRMGHFSHNDEVAVLNDMGNGWSLVESRKADGSGTCFGFIANRALAAPDVPDPPEWVAPLAMVRLNPGEKMEKAPVIETPAQYCQRTAWTPELFVMELKAKSRLHPQDLMNGSSEQLVAIQ
ncbi:MAG: N-acetylmuramoyl-L-alanine amidase [Fibrobacteres bacterium]|nr:N-acetylmuramoyl-L-alanine amidase [Fibrobacterota bacterium]